MGITKPINRLVSLNKCILKMSKNGKYAYILHKYSKQLENYIFKRHITSFIKYTRSLSQSYGLDATMYGNSNHYSVCNIEQSLPEPL